MCQSKTKLQPNTESDDTYMSKQKENYEICENTYFTYIVNKIPVILLTISNAVCKVIHVVISLYGIYFVWTMLHFFASHLYIQFCVPLTFIGFIASPFMTATPHCQGLRWIIFNGAAMINNMWLIFGSWMGSILLNIPQASAS
jgi:hypothetical protein